MIVTTRNSKAGEWWQLWAKDPNLNHAKPFIILVMTHWNGWDAVNSLNQSKITQSWCEKWITAQANFDPYNYPKHVVVTVSEPTTQPKHFPTIHYTNNDRLEWLRCWEISKSMKRYSILVWYVGAFDHNCHHPQLKSWGVVMVIHTRSKSQTCKTIHHTCNDTLERLGCRE